MTRANILDENSKGCRYDRILNAPDGPHTKWLEDMAMRPGAVLEPIEFDPKRYPEQQYSEPKLKARDPYWMLPDSLYYHYFEKTWIRPLGGRAVWDSLVDQISCQPTSPDDDTPLMQKTAELMNEGKNIMVVTSHFTFEELGYLKALRFAIRRDRSRMNHIGTVVNKLMARQTYRGKPLVRQFARCSNVYFSYPKTESSERFGVPENIRQEGNILMIRTLRSDMKESPGNEIDIALTGKQIVPVQSSTGELDHYQIPDIDPASVALIQRFDYIYGATMIQSPEGKWELRIGNLIDVEQEIKCKKRTPKDVVDDIYLPIAESVHDITGVRTVYNCLGERALNSTEF